MVRAVMDTGHVVFAIPISYSRLTETRSQLIQLATLHTRYFRPTMSSFFNFNAGRYIIIMRGGGRSNLRITLYSLCRFPRENLGLKPVFRNEKVDSKYHRCNCTARFATKFRLV